ncbi:GlsB/YeaQ/YmgE family stress response membrane protein [Pararobbsia alpina]|uniref:hypothetical protein n=1 Tax=Pararobbsia alpina TaxID=621374 RepID=UPI0039A5C275
MGWLGTAILAALIGMAGWRFHPSAPARLGSASRSAGLDGSQTPAGMSPGRPGARFGTLVAAAVAACAALVVKLAGNASGAFSDGQSLEWLATVLAAILAVAILGRVSARRRDPGAIRRGP